MHDQLRSKGNFPRLCKYCLVVVVLLPTGLPALVTKVAFSLNATYWRAILAPWTVWWAQTVPKLASSTHRDICSIMVSPTCK